MKDVSYQWTEKASWIKVETSLNSNTSPVDFSSAKMSLHLLKTPTVFMCACSFQTVMDFRHPDGGLVALVLPGRSLLVMKGESRYLWTHGWAPMCFSDLLLFPDSIYIRFIYFASNPPKSFSKLKARAVPPDPLFSQDYSSQVWCGAILWPTVLCSSANWQSDSEQLDFKQEGHPHILHIPQDQTRAVPLWWETYCPLTVMWFLTGSVFEHPFLPLGFPSVCDSQRVSAVPELSLPSLPTCHTDAAHLEKEYVHRVYNSIAPHFSSTRHSPWPRVCHFLSSLPPGSMLADVGCGNGKYLSINPEVIAVSISLLSFCVPTGMFPLKFKLLIV